jgi:hypothetical protein
MNKYGKIKIKEGFLWFRVKSRVRVIIGVKMVLVGVRVRVRLGQG